MATRPRQQTTVSSLILRPGRPHGSSRTSALDVAILTTGHDSEDGRLVRHRKALERAGLTVELRSRGSTSRGDRFILGPWWALRQIRALRPATVILPDPELHLAVSPFACRWTAVVSDVHEDYSAAMHDRAWIGRSWSPAIRVLLALLERVRRRYSTAVIVVDPRIDPTALVVTNQPSVEDLPAPRPGIQRNRLVYVGDVRESRGTTAMLELLRRVPEAGLDIIGPCANDGELMAEIARAGLEGRVTYHGRLSYESSWQLASGALAGLSLLDPTPAFLDARPTKIWEYWIVGLPILATNLPGQRELITQADGGIVGDIGTLADELRDWLARPAVAREIGLRGRRFVEATEDDREGVLATMVREAAGSGGRRER